MSSNLLLSFYGDDFTGSTDAMESLALAGVKTMLFTSPPSADQLAEHPGLQAFGIAGQTRSMKPDEMQRELQLAVKAMKSSGARLAHYKVCSTFDSSPEIGNIGKVIELGSTIFSAPVPIVVGSPDLGRYCVFGNLFARCGSEPSPYRLDRHPSMSMHPVTPMHEADLRLHLAKQTDSRITLFDLLQLNAIDAVQRYESLLSAKPDAVLFDTLYPAHMPIIGNLLDRDTTPFVVGSSGVESALTAHWAAKGDISGHCRFERIRDEGPILAVCGSMSPVTARQIKHALLAGFAEVELPSLTPVDGVAESIQAQLASGRSVVVHTGERQDSLNHSQRLQIGQKLGWILLQTLKRDRPRRVVIAGGDTSGEIARVLKIESMEMIGTLIRGAPLCKVHAPDSPADGLEMVFKGGQIGGDDFFSLVRNGTSAGVK